ncbi:MAG: hypothetical protein ABJN96_13605 [Marinomonas sp.]
MIKRCAYLYGVVSVLSVVGFIADSVFESRIFVFSTVSAVCFLFADTSLNSKMLLNKTAKKPNINGKKEGSSLLLEIGLPRFIAVTR